MGGRVRDGGEEGREGGMGGRVRDGGEWEGGEGGM